MGNSYIKVKKRYNKFIAYLLANSFCIMVFGIVGIFIALSDRYYERFGPEIAVMSLLASLAGAVTAFLITLFVFRRTPKNERLMTWLRCLLLGLTIILKIVLTVFLITIPLLIKLDLEAKYYEYDYTGYFDGDEIRLKRIEQGKYEDSDGNIYYAYE